jgi:predicted amidohydrolase YtcJ
MRLTLLSAAFFLAACTPALPIESEATQKVTVFTNGTIYTGLPDPATGAPATVQGIVVGEDGRIIATIPPMSEDWSEEEVNLVDLGGAFLYPGFTDAHIHLQGIGER